MTTSTKELAAAMGIEKPYAQPKPQDYVAAEPDAFAMTNHTPPGERPEEVYRDQTGKFHDSREDAIAANFEADRRRAINQILTSGDPAYASTPVFAAYKLVGEFIEKHPEMTRVMLGDRDAT